MLTFNAILAHLYVDVNTGKTTQVPQLVLDDYIERGCGALCNIIVTQPRRISAVSVAEQIARERVEKVGLSVGYHIRLEAVKSASTRLLLMTTGVLLRKLQADDCNLEGVSHIFVDEVHERDINTDFLLIVLKKMLSINPHIKIILMSATLNADLFIDYFRNNDESSNDSISCALISIPGRAFPVNDFYLEDVLEQTGFEIDAGSDYAIKSSSKSSSKQGASKGQAQSANEKEYRKTLAEKHQREQHIANLRKQKKYSDKTLNSLLIADESIVNLDLIQKLVVHILTLDNTVVSGDNVGAILIFVPGLADIRSVIDILNERPEVSNSNSKVKVFPLHSSLSSQEQSRVFQILPHGARKIIVSTNIAGL
jgi:ATP-dependent RNA helicase DHX57